MHTTGVWYRNISPPPPKKRTMYQYWLVSEGWYCIGKKIHKLYQGYPVYCSSGWYWEKIYWLTIYESRVLVGPSIHVGSKRQHEDWIPHHPQ